MQNRFKRIYGKAFGFIEEGEPDVPSRRGSAFISRLSNGAAMGCTWCFPHGWETRNATLMKDYRCWKRYRKKQYRPAGA